MLWYIQIKMIRSLSESQNVTEVKLLSSVDKGRCEEKKSVVILFNMTVMHIAKINARAVGEILKQVWLDTIIFWPQSKGSCSSWQWQKDKLSVMHPKLKQGRGNSHTVTRPAFIQRQLVPPSGKAVPGQNKTGYTFGHAKSASAPSVYKLREANHNFTLWFVKSHSSTGGTKKTFKSINFMAYRITYCFYCSM